MKARREFLRSAYLFLFTASCSPEKLFGTCSERTDAVTAERRALPLTDVFIVESFTGLQLGTKDNPYSVRTAGEFDALLRFLVPTPALAIHLEGAFETGAVYRWGQYASRNLGRDWTVDGDCEISIDPDAIANVDAQPLYCLAGPAARVSGIRTRGNHSAIADRWQGSLRTGGVLLEGQGSIDRVTFSAFGAIGAETFVAEIVGSGDITGSEFRDFDPAASDSQVTVFRTIASENGERSSHVLSIHERNRTFAPGSRLVQAHTIYQSPGVVRFNTSVGADVLYYGDYFQSRHLAIEDNDADECVHGVQLKLSPTPMPEAATFSHEDYEIGRNRFASSGAQVSIDTVGPTTSTRFIRNIRIDPSLSVENFGGDITRGSCRMAA